MYSVVLLLFWLVGYLFCRMFVLAVDIECVCGSVMLLFCLCLIVVGCLLGVLIGFDVIVFNCLFACCMDISYW